MGKIFIEKSSMSSSYKKKNYINQFRNNALNLNYDKIINYIALVIKN